MIIRLARSWSLAVSMVALVLIPTLAAFRRPWRPRLHDHDVQAGAIVLVIVSVVTIPAAVMLARYQARGRVGAGDP